jgi:AAA family ATP:ADP antiporter
VNPLAALARSGLGARAQRALSLHAGELPAVTWAFLYFFCLLGSYYLIRPLRDAMGIAGGVDKLQWLFTATFVVMLAAVPLYGWAVSRVARRRLLPLVYGVFIAKLALFFVLMRAYPDHALVARAFFVWVSVYNLFVVSVFWSFMVDVFTPARAARLFPVIAAGGTAGALAGPALAGAFSLVFDPVSLLALSAALLGATLPCIARLAAWSRTPPANGEALEPLPEAPAVGGSILAGFTLVLRSPYLLGICVLMLLFTTLATFLYFQQAYIVRDAFADTATRTAVFAAVDFVTNALTLGIQLFLTARLVQRLGLAATLALVPALLTVGFAVLALAPTLIVVLTVQVLRRAGNYALMRPAREMLYTVLDRERKYKSKGFIDTAVYRGGDAVSAWAYAALGAAGLGAAGIAAVAVPIGALWTAVAFALGRHQRRLQRESEQPPAAAVNAVQSSATT